MILSKYQITILNLFLISLLQIFWMFNRNKKTTLLSGFVNAEGFEPSTACLEGRCSIQLSYASINNQSGWQDSNLRPPAPKAGAITELRYTPKCTKAESKGFEPLVQFPIRMFSKHVLSATQATLHNKNLYRFLAVANVAF